MEPRVIAPALTRLAVAGGVLVLLVALAAAWRWTALADWISPAALVAAARDLGDAPSTPFVVLMAYVVGGLCVVPVMLLIAVTGVVFGPVEGSLYALVGAVLSAAATYYAGRRLGRDAVRRLAGARVNRLSESIARRGVVAMALIRLLPLAPFTVVNVVAGASHIRARDFLLGTALGMAPGILVTTTFVHQLADAAEEPSAAAFAVLALAALAIIVAAKLLRRTLS